MTSLSARGLSEIAGLSSSHIRQIEAGKCKSLSLDTLELLAETLGSSLDWLVSGRTKAPSREKVRAAVRRAEELRPRKSLKTKPKTLAA